MLILKPTTEKIRIVTGSAGTIHCYAVWADSSDPVTFDNAMAVISTATTTDLVPVTATNDRNIQTLTVRNAHASITNLVTVELYDGTTAFDIFKASLGPGEQIQFLDGVGFQVLTNSGAVKTSQNQGSNAVNSGLNVAVLAADVTNNNGTANTIADVTGLSFPVTAGKKYWFRFVIDYTAAATTTGSRWTINGPAITRLSYISKYALTSTTQTTNYGLAAYDLPAASNASSAATGSNLAVIEGIITPSATGTVIARFASEIASSAIVAKAGSVVYYQEVA